MDANTQLAVDIMVRTSMGNAAGDFTKALARMEADARAFVARLNKVFAGINNPSRGFTGVNLGGGFTGAAARPPNAAGGATGVGDPDMARALKDIQRYQTQRTRWESDYTNHVNRQAEAQFRARASSYRKSAEAFQATLDQQKRVEAGSGTGLGLLGQFTAGNLLAQGIAATTAKVKQGIEVWVNYSSAIEQAKIGFTTMTGSVTTAQRHLDELQQFAAHTPFQFEELVRASQKMQGVGIEAEKIIPILTDVGNALAAAGRIEDLPFATKALSDIQAKGKLAGQEIIQLANAGIPALDILSKALGRDRGEILKLSESGQISAKLLFDALHRVAGERFGDAMQKQTKTFSGAILNIEDQLKIASAMAFKPFFNQLSHLAVELGDRVQAQGSDFEAVGSLVADYIVKGIGMGLGKATGIAGAATGTWVRNLFSTSELEAAAQRMAEQIRAGNIGAAIGTALSQSIKSTIGGGGLASGFFAGITGLEDNSLNNARLQVKLKAAIAMNDAELKGTPFDANAIFEKSLSPEDNLAAVKEITDQIVKARTAVTTLPDIGEQLKLKEALNLSRQLADAQRKLSLSVAEGEFAQTRARLGAVTLFGRGAKVQNVQQLASAQADYIRQQISNQKKGFDEEIRLNADDKVKVQKIQLEKKEAVTRLNNELVVNSITAQKQISDINREYQERDRKAAIQYYQQLGDAARNGADKVLFEIDRGLADGSISYRQAYDKEIEATNAVQASMLSSIRNRLALELQDRELTGNERIGLINQAHLDEQRAELDHGKTMFQIQQQRIEDVKRQIQQFADSTVDTITSRVDFIGNALDSIFGERTTSGRAANMFERVRQIEQAEVQDLIQQIRDVKAIMERLNGLRTTRTTPPTAPVSAAPDTSGQRRFLTPEGGSVIIDATTGLAVPDNGAEALARIDARTRAGMQRAVPQGNFLSAPLFTPQGDVTGPVPVMPPVEVVQQESQERRTVLDDELAYLRRSKAQLIDFFKGVKTLYESFEPTAEGVDRFALNRLKLEQDAQDKAQQILIDAQTSITEKTTDPRQKLIEQQKLMKMTDDQRVLNVTHLKEEQDQYSKSIAGLTEYNKALAEGDKWATAYAQNKAIKDRLNEEAGLRERLIEIQDRQANSGVIDALQIEVALREHVLDIHSQEIEAIKATGIAQLDIAQQTEYSAAQANAQVIQFMAAQKGVTQIVGDFKVGLINSGYDLIDRGLDRIIPKMGILGNVIKDMVSSFLKLALNAAFRRLFGLDKAATVSGGSSGGGGIGGILQQFLGFGGGGGTGAGAAQQATGTPNFNPGAGGGNPLFGGGRSNFGGGFGTNNAAGNQFWSSLLGNQQQNTGTLTPGGGAVPVGGQGVGGTIAGAGASVRGIGGLGGISKFLNSPAFAGGLAGLGIGIGIGGGSGLGGIIGGVGGALAGGAGAVIAGGLFTGGIAGASAALAATPFAIIGAGLLIAAYFIGRAARARKEKAQVVKLSGDALNKIKQLVQDVKAFKITGSEAYNAGVQIRDDFAEQLKSLKSGSAKKLGQAKLTEINSMLGTLKVEADRSDRMRNVAKVTDEKLVPTFDVGGFTGFNYGARAAIVHAHEAVVNQQNIMALGGYRALQRAGVRGMNMSGAPDRYERTYSGSGHGGATATGDDRPIYVIPVFGEDQADAMFDMVSEYGVAKKVSVASKQDLAGMNDMLAKKLSGG